MTPQYEQVFAAFDREVRDGVDAVLEQEGYVKDGEPDEPVAKATAAERFVDVALVKSKVERSKKALTRGKFYQTMFPTGPASDASIAAGGPDVDNLSRVDRAVYEHLASMVWDLTQAGRSGYIQRHLDTIESSLVLCRVTIHNKREKNPAAYVTDNDTLILEDAVDKEIASAMKRIKRLRGDVDMYVRRRPGIRGAVNQRLAIEVAKIAAELTLPDAPSADVEDKPQLTAAGI